MGHKNISEVSQLGEFQLDPSEKLATIAFNGAGPTRLSLTLMDHLGRCRLDEKIDVDETKKLLQIELPDLENGTYHAWIEIDGTTLIRTIVIKNQRKSGLLGQVKKIFGFGGG